MRMMAYVIGLLLGILIGYCTSEADDKGTFARYSLGINAPGQYSISNIKSLSLGYQGDLGDLFQWKGEVGGWADNSSNPGRKNSLFGIMSVGAEADMHYFYAHYFQGAGFISHPDNLLGSYFQFCEQVGLGFQGKRNIRIGANYTHISNAGLFPGNNRGRDAVGLQVQVPF